MSYRIGSVLLFFVCCAPAVATSPEEKVEALTLSESEECVSREHRAHNWYVGMGMTNYHPGLRESEARIDRQLNNVFGWLPFWKRPTTFADWRDRFMLWDIVVGVGRDITPNTVLMLWTGGATATIRSKERYGPLATDIRFSRTSAFLTPEFFWYPRGRIDYSAAATARGGDRVRAALAGAKPYVAFAAGYTFVRAEADVRFKAPVIGAFFRQGHKEDHHMYNISPRAGVELPVGEHTSITAVAIYFLFGPHHHREYNGPSISFSVRRKF